MTTKQKQQEPTTPEWPGLFILSKYDENANPYYVVWVKQVHDLVC